jgi:hypothetical protein
MSSFRKLVLCAVLLVMSLWTVASAGATVATVTGGPNFTGAATSASLFKNHNSGKIFSCTGALLVNGSAAASTSGSIPPGFRVGTVTPAVNGCNIVGGLTITVACQPAAFVVTGLTVAGHTPGAITGISCHLFVTSQTACRKHIVGSTGARFVNGPARIILDSAHQNLSRVNSTNGAGGACAVLPNDASARWTNPTGGDLQFNLTPTNLTLNVTP